ncbi:hypothetical protein ACQY0O_002092 [Thecaphora frezii]
MPPVRLSGLDPEQISQRRRFQNKLAQRRLRAKRKLQLQQAQAARAAAVAAALEYECYARQASMGASPFALPYGYAASFGSCGLRPTSYTFGSAWAPGGVGIQVDAQGSVLPPLPEAGFPQQDPAALQCGGLQIYCPPHSGALSSYVPAPFPAADSRATTTETPEATALQVALPFPENLTHHRRAQSVSSLVTHPGASGQQQFWAGARSRSSSSDHAATAGTIKFEPAHPSIAEQPAVTTPLLAPTEATIQITKGAAAPQIKEEAIEPANLFHPAQHIALGDTHGAPSHRYDVIESLEAHAQDPKYCAEAFPTLLGTPPPKQERQQDSNTPQQHHQPPQHQHQHLHLHQHQHQVALHFESSLSLASPLPSAPLTGSSFASSVDTVGPVTPEFFTSFGIPQAWYANAAAATAPLSSMRRSSHFESRRAFDHPPPPPPLSAGLASSGGGGGGGMSTPASALASKPMHCGPALGAVPPSIFSKQMGEPLALGSEGSCWPTDQVKAEPAPALPLFPDGLDPFGGRGPLLPST